MSKPPKVLISLLALLAVAAIGAVVWYVARDNPDEASIEGALAGRTTTTADATTGATDGDSESGGSASPIDGTWSVETGASFYFDSAEGTFAGFRVEEELVGIGATEAVGHTGDVSGTMTIEAGDVSDARFEVDLTTIRSDREKREDRIQDALETSQFPTATFEITEPIDLPDDAADGEEVSVTATGDLTIHGVTKSVEFPLDAKLSDGTVAVAGSLDVSFADYGVEVPSAPAVVSAEDHGPIELQLVLVKG